MAEDPNVHPHWAAETKHIAKCLDELDYFQVLGLDTTATPGELKERYHALLRNYHPDAFFSSPDEELRLAVTRIAKRIAEAYVILRVPEKRARYAKDIVGPERTKKLRFTEESERDARKDREDECGKTPRGRELWKKATAAMQRGDWAGAERDLRTALLFESDTEKFRAALAEVRQKLGK